MLNRIVFATVVDGVLGVTYVDDPVPDTDPRIALTALAPDVPVLSIPRNTIPDTDTRVRSAVVPSAWNVVTVTTAPVAPVGDAAALVTIPRNKVAPRPDTVCLSCWTNVTPGAETAITVVELVPITMQKRTSPTTTVGNTDVFLVDTEVVSPAPNVPGFVIAISAFR
jgi:hypothetical protein